MSYEHDVTRVHQAVGDFKKHAVSNVWYHRDDLWMNNGSNWDAYIDDCASMHMHRNALRVAL